ncbi:hypothetical protein VCB84_000199 [Providencia rettgeri]|nr:hypothetical protein [Providencia rettgeri]EJD6641057.1 hypothetical protein [Providencia rettgeri]ELL9155867.1 hypothetical protein [Providencia rettgeri]ELR5047269.1 hypothetical protein [Providencia rettgeri]ELR5060885.1 hypothetical protein [Providencia rettgeri]
MADIKINAEGNAELTTEQVKKVVRCPLGGTYDGAMLLSAFWRYQSYGTGFYSDPVLTNKVGFFAVICVENKLLQLRLNPIINAEGTDWDLESDIHLAVSVRDEDFNHFNRKVEKIDASAIQFLTVKDY